MGVFNPTAEPNFGAITVDFSRDHFEILVELGIDASDHLVVELNLMVKV